MIDLLFKNCFQGEQRKP